MVQVHVALWNGPIELWSPVYPSNHQQPAVDLDDLPDDVVRFG